MCGKKVNELESSENSVVVSLEHLSPMYLQAQKEMGKEMCITTMSYIGGQSSAQTLKDLRRNIHGDDRFIVKCQLPLISGQIFGVGLELNPHGDMMVYDEQKSFTVSKEMIEISW